MVKKSEEIPLRELIKNQGEMLNRHIEHSSKFREEVKIALTSIDVHSEYNKIKISDHKKELEDQSKRVTKLESAHNWMKGVIAVLSFLGLGGLAAKLFGS